MTMHGDELKRVAREQVGLYEAMMQSIWGDRMVLGMTAAALGGFGVGLLFSNRWGARYAGTLCYALAGMMELYAAMSPKAERREPAEVLREARAA
jgi:hypothetical protein